MNRKWVKYIVVTAVALAAVLAVLAVVLFGKQNAVLPGESSSSGIETRSETNRSSADPSEVVLPPKTDEPEPSGENVEPSSEDAGQAPTETPTETAHVETVKPFEPKLLTRNDWADDVKKALNDFLTTYGTDGSASPRNQYVVFDFDNTCSIFDVEEQLAVYQLETMAFSIRPESLQAVLLTDLLDVDEDRSSYGYGKGSFTDWADDIAAAYTHLWNTYGPFDCKGLSEEKAAEVQSDPMWAEFATKMLSMYSLIFSVESEDVAYPWILYWFTGMTEDEIYDLAVRGFTVYKDVDSALVEWKSPATITSKVGVVTRVHSNGIAVTENIRELFAALDHDGFDVWICSASCTGAIRAAVDVFGLHDSCKGLLAMTNKTDENGRYVASYDLETGCGYYALDDGSWKKMSRPTKSQTHGEGKVTAITNAIAPEYGGKGPYAGFMDSSGDFSFCTEFETLKLVVCFNRASRSVREGGGLVAAVAIYERDALHYDLAKANASGDTLYVLQGRDETGKRSFRNSNSTVILGLSGERLFLNAENDALLAKLKADLPSVGTAFNTLALKQKAGENGLSFDTGFLTEYSGYHSHK